MILSVNDFESPVVNLKTLNELLNIKEQQEQTKLIKNSIKDSFITIQVKCELLEAAYDKVFDQFTHFKPIFCRKMSFPEIIMPDDYRNDFYITVISGEFSKAKYFEFIANLVQFKKENDKYVEVGVDLDRDDNDQLPQSKNYFLYKSIIYAKQEKPKWHEIIKISIPSGKKVERIRNTYLRFILRARSLTSDGNKVDKLKYYGKCYLKITNEDGSAMEDKSNLQLFVTKIDDNDFQSIDSSTFIKLKPTNLPVQASVSSSNQMNNDKNKEFLLVKVNVVSTQLTQNATLLKLLSFQTEKKPDEQSFKLLKTYLDELFEVKDKQSAEIVKFLQPLFEKLIDILLDLNIKHNTNIEEAVNDRHKNEIQPLVFKILVSIFQIIDNQNKFASFRDVVDAYLNKNFSITLAHRPLFKLLIRNTRSIHDYFSDQLRKTNSKLLNEATLDNILNAIKSIEYIFKFAFKSRELLSLYK